MTAAPVSLVAHVTGATTALPAKQASYAIEIFGAIAKAAVAIQDELAHAHIGIPDLIFFDNDVVVTEAVKFAERDGHWKRL